MYFIDRNEIEYTLKHMEKLLILYGGNEEWKTDLTHSLALARLTHVVIESIIDVGNTMIDGFIMRDPGGYEDIIDIMDDEKVIAPEMADPLKNVIGLRKMIVREFINVDTKSIIEVLNESMEALEAFPNRVRHYLEHELGPVSAFLPADEKVAKTKKYNAYCFDLDGTVFRGMEPIPEAVSFIKELQANGIEPYFITNNASLTPLQLQIKLDSLGVKTSAERIVTSALVAAKYCKEAHSGASVMMVGEKGLKDALESEGVQLTENNPDVVVMGIDWNINYEKLANACLAVRAGAHFIATNADKAVPTEKGLLPGNGSFVKLVEHATGKKPIFFGKPEPHMLSYIQSSGGYEKEEMIMIGDNYDTDILAGIQFGIDTIHVEGGFTSREEALLKAIQPTYPLQTLAEWELLTKA